MFEITMSKSPSLSKSAYAAPFENETSLSPHFSLILVKEILPSFL